MDNLQFWLYVIIGVIYLITQVRKKAREQAPPPKRPAQRQQPASPQFKPEPQQSSPKPISFEDLLREITEAKNPKQEEPPTYAPYKQPEYVDNDDDVEDEEDEYKPVIPDYRNTDPIYKQYEEAKIHDYSRDSLEESLKLENVAMKYGRFTEFESGQQGTSVLQGYVDDLRDPEGFKKAIIMSEILNRKHF